MPIGVYRCEVQVTLLQVSIAVFLFGYAELHCTQDQLSARQLVIMRQSDYLHHYNEFIKNATSN
jgi:hypothetical protein